MLTYSSQQNNIPSNNTFWEGFDMKGGIYCNACSAKMTGMVCKKCGKSTTYIKVYFDRAYHYFRKDKLGYSLTFASARDRITEIALAIRQGKFNPIAWSDNATQQRKFDRMMQKWLDEKSNEVKENELSPEYCRIVIGYNKNYYRFLHDYDVKDITLEVLSNFKDTLTGLKIKSKKNVLSTLHIFFNWLYRRGIIERVPPFPHVKGDDSAARIALEIEDQQEIIEKIPERHRDIFTFLCETGLRPGEVCALKAGDADLKNEKILIQRTWSDAVLRETTKGKNKKWIPLSSIALEIVLKNIKSKFGNDWLFVNPDTQRHYRAKKLDYLWRQTGAMVTLYEGTRHSFCTQVAEIGDALLTRDLMRHADLRTTQKYYHSRMVKLKELVEKRYKVIDLKSTKVSY